MACYTPLQAYYPDSFKTGSKRMVFDVRLAIREDVVPLPCGQCIGCRLKYSRDWAIRCCHEASLYKDNSFITLTYAPDKLPLNQSIEYRDWTLFMKKLRKSLYDIEYYKFRDGGFSVSESHSLAKKYGRKIRFFMGAEYGELTMRPHFHAIIFNFYPDDCELISIRNGHRLYKSDFLTKIWGKGYVSVGSVTFESAGYVARYMMKKVKGNDPSGRYASPKFFDPETGECFMLVPEQSRMSNKPGIAKAWFDKFKDTDLYPHDFVVTDGRKFPVPSYYDKKLKEIDPHAYDDIRAARIESIDNDAHRWNSSESRLSIRHEVKLRKIADLKRDLPY